MTEPRKYKANREDWGTLRQRSNGRWQASYLHEGVRYYAPSTFDTKTDARAWLSSQRSDIIAGRWKNPKALAAETFGQYSATWIAQRVTSKGEPLRPKTRVEYERQLAKGLAVFADDALTAITPARVRTWHAERMTVGKTAAAAEARLLRAILTTAEEDGIVQVNPVPAKLTKTSAGKTFRPPTVEELTVLHQHVDARFKLGVLIAAYGGLRLSEWRSLRRSDLSLIDGRYVASVTRQAQHVTGEGWIVGPPKSAKGIRAVTLPAHLTAAIDAHLTEYVGEFDGSLIFPPNGRSEFIHDSTFNDSWVPAQDAAGVRGQVREHDLRDFSASHMLAAGATALEVRDALGHANVRTTVDHYLHQVQDRAAELADRMPTLPAPTPSNVTTIRSKTGTNVS
ncbi:tyrosine-type recombinase/integrase [Microbacterium sp. NPDC090007]|uniref:tyrosine-type recombinase/integrase n=1 Tax=Microbacterium sp. NPDC090007 TaxID=3364204 RepID=UPI00382C56E6